MKQVSFTRNVSL